MMTTAAAIANNSVLEKFSNASSIEKRIFVLVITTLLVCTLQATESDSLEHILRLEDQYKQQVIANSQARRALLDASPSEDGVHFKKHHSIVAGLGAGCQF
jgi:hypothetical protein